MMGNCRDCQHWKPVQEGRFLGTGVCLRIVTYLKRAPLKAPPPPDQSLAFTIQDFANLRTWPDFGCVQFEAKEPA